MANKICIAFGLVLALTCQVYCAVDCNTTGAGRIAEPTDNTCTQYTFCVFDSNNNNYLSYNYTCPTNSFFNPNTAQCSSNYVCNITSANSICTSDGFIADPSSTDCTSYIECVNISGTFVTTNYTCPATTFFNPSTTLCELEYTCPTPTFTCTAAGRFTNNADSTCQTYFMCVLATNGTYVQYQYTCPNSSVFNPTTRVCTTSYTCP
ncbi:unnamed protein product [Diatraea saccharalis]|uniref:Chitin-binding type-2 domain-containing protein n=1 Tax=Diatraea saccharalis TaxID=40085 RepID=A0A9N9WGP4_9NEOP|nr:unnamed protein product [Diatraea saccharalis]